MPYLALLRHGQSQWNLENRFTGWVDVDLTPAGEAQARRSGELLAESGVIEILNEYAARTTGAKAVVAWHSSQRFVVAT